VHEFLWRLTLRRASGLPALLLGLALVYNWLGARDDLVRVMQHRYWTQVHQLQHRLDRSACAVINQPEINPASINACPSVPSGHK
jgi:hypothetical protein